MLKETKKGETHSYPIIYKSYAVVLEDEVGQVVYTFKDKKKRDLFFKELNTR